MKVFLFLFALFFSSCSKVVWTPSPLTKPKSRTAIVYYPVSSKPLTRISGKPPLLITSNGRNYKLKSGKKLYIPLSKSGGVIQSYGENSHAFVESNIYVESGEKDVYIRSYWVFSEEQGMVSTIAGIFSGSKVMIQFERVDRNTALQEMR